MIPGSNLLQMALQVIAPTQNVAYREYLGEQDNEFGSTNVAYGSVTPLYGCSVQPVTKAQIQQTGLAVNKEYIYVWTSNNVEGAYRGRQNDLILWDGSNYEVMPEEDWVRQDGWKRITAVKL